LQDFDEEQLKEIHMGRLIQVLSHQMKRKSCVNSMINDDGLTTMQKHVLKFLLLETLHKVVYQKDIEEEFQIRKSTATGMLQLLEKNGFIVRESEKKDARLKRIIPTKKAEALRPSILAHIRQSETQLTTDISEADVLTCKKVLYQMLYNVSEHKEVKKMNKKLLQSVREYKKQSIITPLLVTLEVLMEVLIPLEMAKIIDIGIAEGNLGYIIQRGLILVIMAMMSLFFGVQAGNFAAIAGAGYAKNLRHDIYYKVQDFSFKNIDHFSTSGLVTRMTTDITNIQMAYMMSIRLLARAPIMIVLSWIMTLTLSKKAALLFLIVIPVLGGTLLFIAKKAHPHFIKVFDEYDDLNNSVQENVNAARVVKAFVREDYEIDKFHGVSKYVYQLFTTAEKIVAWNSPVMQFVMYAVIMILVYIGGKGIVTKTMETGALTSIIVYALQIIGSLMMVTFVFVMIMIAGASTDRITEVLDEIPEMIDPADAVTSVADGDIVFDHVSFSYAGEGGNLSLKDVNLHIKSGQTVGIIGGTGSAKSTLVQLIPRLYDVTEGSVKVSGIDVRKYNLESLRDQVSMVLQKNVLFSGTIYDNIRWGNENATDEEVQNVCKLAQADGFVREFPDGYNTQIVQGGNNVSGGQKQRLCIARALLKKPKILILDDSTSAVDTKTDALIRKAFREEIPNTTKIIIAQRVSSIEDADQIIVLENGEISGIGTSEELLKTNAIYREVYVSQVKGGEDHE
jgi:ATP-binding cassette subfamily B multidrug efflux pump